MLSLEMLDTLVESNVVNAFPQQLQDKIHAVKLGFFAMQDEFNMDSDKPNAERIEIDQIELISAYRNGGGVNPKEQLTEEKKQLVNKLTTSVVGSLPFHFYYCAQTSKRRKKKKKWRKKRKRGGAHKFEQKGEPGILSESGKIIAKRSKEERDMLDGLVNILVRPLKSNEAPVYSDYSDDEEEKDTSDCEGGDAEEKSELNDSPSVSTGEKKKVYEMSSIPPEDRETMNQLVAYRNRPPDVDEELKRKLKWRKMKTRRIARCYETIENRLIDLVNLPCFASKDACIDELASMVEGLMEKHSESNFKELKGLVDMLSIPLDNRPTEEEKQEARKYRVESEGIIVPDPNNVEEFVKVFVETFKNCTPDNSPMLFEMGTIIAEESGSNLLKQKTVEMGMWHFLATLKACVLCYHLYVSELVFKVVMALPCARKYCWRDKEYFPTLSKLLTMLDPNPVLDRYQIRGDAVHILYISVVGAPREIFEMVAATNIFENLMKILDDNPPNERDAQTGEDVIVCVILFTDHWDLFGRQMKEFEAMKHITRWRKYALQYASHLPNFIWSLETLLLRLKVLYQYDKVKDKHPYFRLDTPHAVTSAREFIKTNNKTACSNPDCFKLNDPESEEKYKKCSKCHLACYCTKECQVKHWSIHKQWCKRPSWLPKKEKSLQPTSRKLANHDPQETLMMNGLQDLLLGPKIIEID